MIFALLLAVCTLDVRLPAGPARNEPEVDTIVLHHTALATTGNSIRTLRLRGMSYHYIIDEDGVVIQAVPFIRTGRHAAGANKTSIGIAFVGGASRAWAPNEKQRAAANDLIVSLLRTHPTLHYIVGHGDIRDTNAGEPYGLGLETIAAETGLRHPSKDEEPLLDFRTAALELFASPRMPRRPSRSTRWPDHESVSCPDGPASHIRYKVSTIGASPP
jgi:hypothetical protein